jgi:hypothetical protein
MKFIERKPHKLWSIWIAGFWGAVGAVIVILSALLYQHFDWRIGTLLILASATFAIARVLKQPGTDND